MEREDAEPLSAMVSPQDSCFTTFVLKHRKKHILIQNKNYFTVTGVTTENKKIKFIHHKKQNNTKCTLKFQFVAQL